MKYASRSMYWSRSEAGSTRGCSLNFLARLLIERREGTGEHVILKYRLIKWYMFDFQSMDKQCDGKSSQILFGVVILLGGVIN